MTTLERRISRRKVQEGGMTIFELTVALAIAALVMSSVLYLQYISSRIIKETYGPTNSRCARMIALNEIRFRLADAKTGSCQVSNSNHTIEYCDPNQRDGTTTMTSRLSFDSAARQLYYRRNILSGSDVSIAKGPINITFTRGSIDLDPLHSTYMGTDAVVTIFVQTSAELAYSNVDLRDGETVVYLRNL